MDKRHTFTTTVEFDTHHPVHILLQIQDGLLLRLGGSTVRLETQYSMQNKHPHQTVDGWGKKTSGADAVGNEERKEIRKAKEMKEG